MLSLLLVCIGVMCFAGRPYRGTPARRFTVRARAAGLGELTLRPPGGLIHYVNHAGKLFASESSFRYIPRPGLWYGAAVASVLLAVLIVTAGFWTRPDPGVVAAAASWWFAPLLVAALIAAAALGGFLRWQRINGPMLRDETDTLCRNVWGRYVEENGVEKFRANGWDRTFFENGGANNPVLFSLVSRLCNEAWQSVSGSGPAKFYRPAVRFPSYAAGLLSVAAIFWVTSQLVNHSEGLVAAGLLAIHPWHIRYSVEGRGYAMAMFFALLSWLFIVRALRSGRWKHWALFAAAQFAMLYSFTGALYLAAAQTLCSFAAIALMRKPALSRWIQAGRLAVCCTVSASVYLVLMMPCAPQILNYLRKPTTYGPVVSSEWWAETLGAFTGGVNLGIYKGEPPPEFTPVWNLRDLAFTDPPLALLILVTVTLAGAGVWRIARRDLAAAAVAAAMILGPAASYIHNALTGHYLFPWYLIYALPAFVIAVACGVGTVADLAWVKAGAKRLRVPSFTSVSLIFILLFAYAIPKGFYRSNDATGHAPIELLRGTNVFVIYSDGRVVQRKPRS